MSVPEIAARLGRGEKSVRGKAGALGLRRHGRKSAWSSREIKTLERLYGTADVRELAARMGRTRGAIYQKAREMHITGRPEAGPKGRSK